MVACVTFETVKVTDPIKYYDCTKVHLIHYVKNNGKSEAVYRGFYDSVVKTIREISSDIRIYEHFADVTDFQSMLKEVHLILDNEVKSSDKMDIYVNISAGPSEYVAAASIVSMMFPDTIPFSVPSAEYTIKADAYYDKETGNPIGITRKTKEPCAMQQFKIECPERHLVLGLRILNHYNKGDKYPKGTDMIRYLKQNGLWLRGECMGETSKRSESVYYQRDFVDKWVDRGWVYRDVYLKKYILTMRGQSIISTFYVNDIELS